MIENLLQSIQANPWVAPFTVFLAGLLTASNPCVLGLIPLMVGASGAYQGQDRSYWKAFKFSVMFVVGLSSSFMILGILAYFTGSFINPSSPVWTYILAVLCIIMGLMFAEVITFNIKVPEVLKKPRTGLLGALVLGFLFGFVSTPCAVPILAVLLALIATGKQAFGWFLMFIYGLGHSALILVAGVSIGFAQAYINNKGLTESSRWVRRIAGLLIVGFGLYLLLIA